MTVNVTDFLLLLGFRCRVELCYRWKVASSRALGLFFVVAVAAGRGCSLLVSTSGFSDGATSSEAGAQDASAPIDALSDAPAKTDAASVCDATFCDSFDDGPLGARWDSRDGPVAATLALVPAANSAPSALELDLAAGKPSSTVERRAFLTKLLGVKAGTVSCRFQVNLLLSPGPGAGDFAPSGSTWFRRRMITPSS